MVDDFITIGGLADMVGVTVRTIQYYDQAGLLKPSAKGNRNQRLYTKEDIEKLYKILCLKFMGMSLIEIKQSLAEYNDKPQVEELIVSKICDMEKSIAELLKRFTTLNNLKDVVRTDKSMDWQHYANVIERFADDGKYFWKLNCVYEENAYIEPDHLAIQNNGDVADNKNQSVIVLWHNLIADAIALLHCNEPVDSKNSKAIAKRYLAMEQDFSKLPASKPHRDFVLFDTKTAVLGQEQHPVKQEYTQDQDSFYQLRYDVNEFIQKAIKAYRNE